MIHKKILQTRKELGLTQQELSDRSGVRTAAISGFETGKTDLKVNESLIKIMKVLKLQIIELP